MHTSPILRMYVRNVRFLCAYAHNDVHVRSVRLLDVQALGSFIKDLRQRRGLSQSQLASAAGVSRRWLTGLEAGKSTVELGLVLKTIHALELELHVTSAMDEDAISLETVLRNLGGS